MQRNQEDPLFIKHFTLLQLFPPGEDVCYEENGQNTSVVEEGIYFGHVTLR